MTRVRARSPWPGRCICNLPLEGMGVYLLPASVGSRVFPKVTAHGAVPGWKHRSMGTKRVARAFGLDTAGIGAGSGTAKRVPQKGMIVNQMIYIHTYIFEEMDARARCADGIDDEGCNPIDDCYAPTHFVPHNLATVYPFAFGNHIISIAQSPNDIVRSVLQFRSPWLSVH
jgi:hypothetical protein